MTQEIKRLLAGNEDRVIEAIERAADPSKPDAPHGFHVLQRMREMEAAEEFSPESPDAPIRSGRPAVLKAIDEALACCPQVVVKQHKMSCCGHVTINVKNQETRKLEKVRELVLLPDQADKVDDTFVPTSIRFVENDPPEKCPICKRKFIQASQVAFTPDPDATMVRVRPIHVKTGTQGTEVNHG